ncbi:MAG: DUF4115 domain-containing protein, partial [Magnetococcales bacterium]|nr:DUF4115 domain-containing protein [Magnetococcales bacterium]
PEVKPEPKAVAKVEPKPEVKPEPKKVTKPEVKKPESKPEPAKKPVEEPKTTTASASWFDSVIQWFSSKEEPVIPPPVPSKAVPPPETVPPTVKQWSPTVATAVKDPWKNPLDGQVGQNVVPEKKSASTTPTTTPTTAPTTAPTTTPTTTPTTAPPAVVSEPAKTPVASRSKKSFPKGIKERFPEVVNGEADLAPESPNAVSFVAKELVWVQILDQNGGLMKDMVMQPGYVFHVPEGGNFIATLGNAASVRVRVGAKELPLMGKAGDMVEGLKLDPETLRKRAEGGR